MRRFTSSPKPCARVFIYMSRRSPYCSAREPGLRKRHFEQLAASLLQLRDRCVHRMGDILIEAVGKILSGDADSQAGNGLVQIANVIFGRALQPGGVTLNESGDDVEHQPN